MPLPLVYNINLNFRLFVEVHHRHVEEEGNVSKGREPL